MKSKLGKVLRVMLLGLIVVFMFNINVSAATSAQASIGKKNYKTVEKALAAVKNGQTIKLNQDITSEKPIFFKKNVKYTFNMNKHKITSKVGASETVGGLDVQAGNVTFTNGTTSAAVFVHEKATVTVKDGTYGQVVNWGKTTIHKGKIVNKKYSSICNYKGTLVINNVTARANYNCIYAEAGTVTVNGGNYKTANSVSTYPLVFSQKATIYINGGNYTKTNGYSVYNEKGKVTIKGGTFTGAYVSILYCGTNSSTVVSGGKFTSEGSTIDAYYGRKKLLINGGTFQAREVLFYAWNEDNIKIDKSKIKLIGSTKYMTQYFV